MQEGVDGSPQQSRRDATLPPLSGAWTQITYEELLQCIAECFKLSQSMMQAANSVVESYLTEAAAALRASPTALRRLQEVLGLGLGIPQKEALAAVRAFGQGNCPSAQRTYIKHPPTWVCAIDSSILGMAT